VAGADEIGCTHVNIDRSAIDCKGGHRRSNPNRATTLIASLERSWPMVHHCVAFLEEAYARFMELRNHGPEVLPPPISRRLRLLCRPRQAAGPR